MSKNIFTTPAGIARYPWISSPDTKFNTKGEYKVQLVLSKDDARPVIDLIDRIYIENLEFQRNRQGKMDIKEALLPYKNELDINGNATGRIIIRFKSTEAYKPLLFDDQGKRIFDKKIVSGSEIRIHSHVTPYYSKLIGAGVVLRIRAVQIINSFDNRIDDQMIYLGSNLNTNYFDA